VTPARPRQVLITTYLEPALVDGLAAEFKELEFSYPLQLLPLPRYQSDHPLPQAESPSAIEQWSRLLSQAEILFDFGPPQLHRELRKMPKLRWIQATSAGVGQFAARVGLDQPGSPVITTARGVHGPALAEFAAMSLIALNRDLLGTLHNQSRHLWVRGAGRLVRGQTVVIVGLGSIGREVARLLGFLGATTVGVVRSMDGRTAPELGVDELQSYPELDRWLQLADVLVLSCPHTPETDRLIDERRLELLRPTAILINLARGQVVDEPALVRALADSRLGGAALDVAATEPLPGDSPLWDLPNVIISPHSASTVAGENQAIVNIFTANLRAYLQGSELTNVLHPGRLY
jgi:glyoxylate/hydroxypyruvate reductase A